MALLTLTQNNTRPTVNFAITDAQGNVVVLTGATVKFNFFPVGGNSMAFQGTCVIDSPSGGICHYGWGPTDLANAGAFEAELEVIFPDTSQQSTNIMGFDVRPSLTGTLT